MKGEPRDGEGIGEGRGAPPRRLVEGHADQQAWAMELLRAAEPYQAPAGRKQRIRLSLGHVPRRAPAVLRPLVAGLVLMSLGAIATAALRPALPRWVSRAVERVVAVVRPARSRVSSVEARRAPRAVRVASASDVAPVPAPPAAPLTPVQVTASVPARPAAEPPVSHARRPARSESREEETGLLLEAMRALRRQHEPARARLLLDRYLQQHPNGALAEEALAMSIEAAVATHDGEAPSLARRYLRSYPAGPFRSVALQALTATPQN